MTLAIKRQLDSIDKRIKRLNLDNMKLVLNTYINIDADNNELYYILRVLDKNNNIVEQTDKIYDKPAKYIEEYTDKYNIAPQLDFYEIKGDKIVLKNDIENLDRQIEVIIEE